MNDHVEVLRRMRDHIQWRLDSNPISVALGAMEMTQAEHAALDHAIAACEREAHPSITHCDNCGLDWLDNGLNPIGCPYCKHAALVVERDLLDQQLADAMATVARMDNEAAVLVARLGELGVPATVQVTRYPFGASVSVHGANPAELLPMEGKPIRIILADDLARVVKESNGG